MGWDGFTTIFTPKGVFWDFDLKMNRFPASRPHRTRSEISLIVAVVICSHNKEIPPLLPTVANTLLVVWSFTVGIRSEWQDNFWIEGGVSNPLLCNIFCHAAKAAYSILAARKRCCSYLDAWRRALSTIHPVISSATSACFSLRWSRENSLPLSVRIEGGLLCHNWNLRLL